MSSKTKKLLILNLPYILIGLFATNLAEAWRIAEGVDMSAKMMSFMTTLGIAVSESIAEYISDRSSVWIGLWCGSSIGSISER